MHVLLVEDDEAVIERISGMLAEQGHTVDWAQTWHKGQELAASNDYAVMVVDRLLPDGDGLDLVSRIRGDGIDVPVLMLTALGAVGDRVAGLKNGADDYLVKPFSIDELEARIAALARRQNLLPARLVIGDVALDRLQRTVMRGQALIPLVHREFALLELLMLSSPSIVTRTMLLEQVWRIRFDPGTNLVESHVSRVRRKLDRGGDPPIIHTIRGEGYVALA